MPICGSGLVLWASACGSARAFIAGTMRSASGMNPQETAALEDAEICRVLLPCWDIAFGTANFELRFDPTGVRDQIEQGRDYGQGFWSQQWLGLKRLASHA